MESMGLKRTTPELFFEGLGGEKEEREKDETIDNRGI